MKLVEDRWSENLNNLHYGDGYDIRIHAAQVALSLISRRTDVVGKEVNFSTVRFGYYDLNTEKAIEAFQRATGLYITRKLDKITYEKLFEVLRNRLNVTILEVGKNKLKVCEINKEISDMLPEHNYPNNDENGNNTLFENENFNPNPYEDEFDHMEGIDWGDFEIGDYEADGGYNPPNFLDNFWKSIKDGTDDVFSILTPDLGRGGSPTLNIRGSGESYVNTNGIPGTGDGSNDFIDNLLANSIYQGNFDYEKPLSWVSNSEMNINVNGFKYDNSDKYGTFFDGKNTSDTRKSAYDITIVYGTNSQLAKKLIDVRPRAKSQQIDASGEAIYEVIEFIAKDVVETDNRKI